MMVSEILLANHYPPTFGRRCNYSSFWCHYTTFWINYTLQSTTVETMRFVERRLVLGGQNQVASKCFSDIRSSIHGYKEFLDDESSTVSFQIPENFLHQEKLSVTASSLWNPLFRWNSVWDLTTRSPAFRRKLSAWHSIRFVLLVWWKVAAFDTNAFRNSVTTNCDWVINHQ